MLNVEVFKEALARIAVEILFAIPQGCKKIVTDSRKQLLKTNCNTLLHNSQTLIQ